MKTADRLRDIVGARAGLRTLIVVGAAWAILVPPPVAGQERTRLLVEFRVDEPEYRARFGAEDLEWIEKQAAQRIAGVLADSLPVLRLVADPPADHRLVVSLHRRGREEGTSLDERGFHAAASPVGGTAGDLEYWGVFRPADASGLGLGSRERFVDEIVDRFEKADLDLLVRRHLSQVPLSHEARYLSRPQMGWVIPFSSRSLCMDVDTELLVRNDLPTGFGVPMREEYRALVKFDLPNQPPPPLEAFANWLYARPVPLQDNLPDLEGVSNPDSVAVEGVYLLRFRLNRHLCGEPVPLPAGPDGGAS
jgi:hypothetical protein